MIGNNDFWTQYLSHLVKRADNWIIVMKKAIPSSTIRYSMKEKSPIPHNRFDQSFFPSTSTPHSPARSVTSQPNSPRSVSSETPLRLTGRALYSFNAQHARYAFLLYQHWKVEIFISFTYVGFWKMRGSSLTGNSYEYGCSNIDS